MNNIWLMILAVMIVCNILKFVGFGPYVNVVIDLAGLGVLYIILKRYPIVDLRRSMIFLGAFTFVSILNDLYIINGITAEIILLCLVGWMIFSSRGGSGRPPRQRYQWHK